MKKCSASKGRGCHVESKLAVANRAYTSAYTSGRTRPKTIIMHSRFNHELAKACTTPG